MESSPLTQQNTPDTQHEPKITQLYLYLFNVLANETGEDLVPDEGFWRELFLLNPDKQRLFQILDPLTADDILHMQVCYALFFAVGGATYRSNLDSDPSVLPKGDRRSGFRNNS